jgi:hypothetical protein
LGGCKALTRQAGRHNSPDWSKSICQIPSLHATTNSAKLVSYDSPRVELSSDINFTWIIQLCGILLCLRRVVNPKKCDRRLAAYLELKLGLKLAISYHNQMAPMVP